MSGYFKPHRAQYSLNQIRLVASTLCALLLVVAAAIIYVLNSSETQATTTITVTHPQGTQTASIPVLVANKRIELGEKIDRRMFTEQQFAEDRLPIGVIPAAQISSVEGKYAKSIIHAGFPVIQEDLSDQIPFHLLPIPNGFRAITIEANASQIVDGHVVPNSRVDVLLRFRDANNREKVKTLIPFAKVLSVNGTSIPKERSNVGQTPSTVSLLVSAKDALRVELARSKGTLSLSLLGTTATGAEQPDLTPIGEGELFGTEEEEELHHENVFEWTDPRSGQLVRRCLSGTRWKANACREEI